MEKSKKITIAIIIIILIILAILVTVVWKTKTESDNIVANETEENISNEENIANETDENLLDEDTENTVSEESINDEENSNTNQNDVGEATPTEPVGIEEEESNMENNGENEEEKVINLAKEAWGISPDSYTFTIDSRQGDTYTVSVSANATVIAYYEVNPKTGEVVEK